MTGREGRPTGNGIMPRGAGKCLLFVPFVLLKCCCRMPCVIYLLLAVLWTVSPVGGDAEVSCVFKESCVLPCRAPHDPEVIWSKTTEMVPIQWYSKRLNFHQLHTFKDRAFLFLDQIQKGNASLLLEDVRPQDDGRYECKIYKNEWTISFINVKVVAPVRAVSLDLVDSVLVCSSEGVYPNPDLRWSSLTEKHNSTVTETEDHLYSIRGFLTVSLDTPHRQYSCNVSTGSSWKGATLTLLPPVVSSGPEATIHCAGPVHFSPIVNLAWTFNRTQSILNQSRENRTYTVSETWRENVKNVSANGSLTLKALTPDQQGPYTCHFTTDTETYITQTQLQIYGLSTTFAVALIAAALIITVLLLCCTYKVDKNQPLSSPPETPQSPQSPFTNVFSRSLSAELPSQINNLVKCLVFILGLGSLLPWHIYVTASLYFKDRINTTVWIFTISLFTLISHLLRLLPKMFSSFHLRFPPKMNITWSLVLIPPHFFVVATLIKLVPDGATFFSVTVAIIWFSMFFSASLQHLDLVPKYRCIFTQGQAAAGTSAGLIMLLSFITNSFDSAAFCHFICAGLVSLAIVLSYFGLSYKTPPQFYLKNMRNSEEPCSNQLLKPDPEQNNDRVNMQNENIHNENIQSQGFVFLLVKSIKFKALYVIVVPTVTLSVFPAVTADVTTVFSGQWEHFFIPVCCFLIFHIFNLIGAVIATWVFGPFENVKVLFPVLVFIRAGFIPLLMFCNVQPRTFLPVAPFLSHDVVFAVIMALFSLSDGCLGWLAVSYALHTVEDKDRETAALLINILLGLGLILGAILSIAFRALI